jgi:phospholipase C
MTTKLNTRFLLLFIICVPLLYFNQTDFITDAMGMSVDVNNDSAKTPIEHVIVISQGKRSFDNYFGTFPGANGITNNTKIGLGPFSPGLVEYTISLWFRTDNDFSGTGVIITKGGLSSEKTGKNMNFGIWMTKDEKIAGGFESNNGTDHIVYSSNSYNDGKWHNILLSANQTLLTMIIDGNEEIRKKIMDLPDANFYPLRIGANFPTASNFFVGDIYGLRIWNKTMPTQEIITSYKNNDTSKLLIHEEFNQTNSIIFQNDGNNYLVLNDFLVLNGTNFLDMDFNLTQDKWLSPFKLTSSKTDNPSNSFDAFLHSYNVGKMDGFYHAQLLDKHDNPNLVMGYYDNHTIPYYWKFASKYVLADNFFGLRSKIFDSLDFLKSNFFSDAKKKGSKNILETNLTFVDFLERKNISMKTYIENIENNQTKSRYNIGLEKQNNIYNLTSYFQDLNNKDFPNIAFIMATDSRDTAPHDVYDGNKFVASLVQALMKSNYWNSSAVILTYSDSGGWYDHVPPPSLDFSFRVPTMIISPYAKNNYIDHTFYNTYSIIKFLQDNFDLGYINKKIQNSSNLFNAFNFSQTPTNPIIIEDMDLKLFEIAELNEKIDVFIVNVLYIIISISITLFFTLSYIMRKKSFSKLQEI